MKHQRWKKKFFHLNIKLNINEEFCWASKKKNYWRKLFHDNWKKLNHCWKNCCENFRFWFHGILCSVLYGRYLIEFATFEINQKVCSRFCIRNNKTCLQSIVPLAIKLHKVQQSQTSCTVAQFTPTSISFARTVFHLSCLYKMKKKIEWNNMKLKWNLKQMKWNFKCFVLSFPSSTVAFSRCWKYDCHILCLRIHKTIRWIMR